MQGDPTDARFIRGDQGGMWHPHLAEGHQPKEFIGRELPLPFADPHLLCPPGQRFVLNTARHSAICVMMPSC